MVLKGKGKISQSGHAKTQYIGIPANIVSDSQYPFKNGEFVSIKLDPNKKELSVYPLDESSSQLASEANQDIKKVWQQGYEKFRDVIRNVLMKNKRGMTWTEIRNELNLPQKVPNNAWVNRMKGDIGLVNERKGKSVIWRLKI